MADNVAVTGHKVIGLNIQVGQGDQTKTYYFKGLNAADYDDMAAAIEASGEYTVLGFSPVYRKEALLDGTLSINQGTADNTKFVQCGLKRTADIGGNEVDVKTMFLTLPISDDTAKADAVKTALLNKTIAGAKVTDVFRMGAQSIGS